MKAKRKWTKAKVDPILVNQLVKDTGLSELEVRILVTKGFDTKTKIEEFQKEQLTYPDVVNNIIKDTDKAAKIILKHVRNGNKIIDYSDYDSDGVNSTILTVSLLRNMGADVDYYINDRVLEGYGICVSGIDKIIQKYPDVKLIITTDNGISGHSQIEYAKSKGIEVVLTDHHEVVVDRVMQDGKEVKIQRLPNADAVVNPKRLDDDFYFGEICGAAVAWRLFAYIYHTEGYDIEFLNSMLDFVAVATITDVMPLRKENRFYVTEGLKLLNNNPKPAFRILSDIMKVRGVINEETLGFTYGPLINCVGRLELDVNEVVETFLSTNEFILYQRLWSYSEINARRKQMTQEQSLLVKDQIDHSKKIIIVKAEGLSEGIIGLIAGDLSNKLGKPAIVFAEGHGGMLKGSGRSILPFPLKDNLDKAQEHIEKYGGHPLAAGLSIKAEKYDDFKKCMEQLADEQLTEDDLVRVFTYIDTLEEYQINEKTYNELKSLEPFGPTFEAPYFRMNNIHVRESMFMPKDDPRHIKLTTDRGTNILGWKLAEKYQEDNEPSWVRLLGRISVNEHRGMVSYQVTIKDDNIASM